MATRSKSKAPSASQDDAKKVEDDDTSLNMTESEQKAIREYARNKMAVIEKYKRRDMDLWSAYRVYFRNWTGETFANVSTVEAQL